MIKKYIEDKKKMEETMAIIKSYTDLSQSKKLSEILPLESADMYYFLDPTPAGNIYHLVVRQIAFGVRTRKPEYDKGDIPCWSLAALLDVIPDSIYDNTNEFSQLEFSKRSIAYRDLNDGIKIGALKDNLVDACYKLILKLHELKML